MNRTGCIFISILASTWLTLSLAHADVVVLTSGEQFTSDKVWEEKGKIRFNMHGLVVSVQKSDVASIIRSDGPTAALHDPVHDTRPTSQDRLKPPPKSQSSSRGQKVAATPPRNVSPPAPSPETSSQQYKKIKGIGFEGITWQMRPTDLPGLSKIGTEEVYGGIDQYWQPDGPLALGNALLDGLVFGFWQDRLYTIMMWIDGKPGFQRLKQAVFQRYGPGEASKNQQDRYVWMKDKTTDRLLEFDPDRNIGIFWMRSRNLDVYIKKRYSETSSG